MFASDEVMKGVLGVWSFEQMEVASYRMPIKAGDRLGDPEIVRAGTQNLDERRTMVQWLDEHRESITDRFLQFEADEASVGQLASTDPRSRGGTASQYPVDASIPACLSSEELRT